MSTVNLDCKLDLKAIALQARNAEYNPKVWDVCGHGSISLSLSLFFGGGGVGLLTIVPLIFYEFNDSGKLFIVFFPGASLSKV